MYTNTQLQVHPHNHSHGEHTHTRKCTQRHMSAHKSHGLEPGSSLDHAPHPHPLSKRPEVNSFPYSVSLSHPAPSHTLTAPITASGANSCQTLNFQTSAPISIFPLEHSVHIISSYFCDPTSPTALVIQVSSITVQWPCDVHKDGPEEQSATLQGPLT